MLIGLHGKAGVGKDKAFELLSGLTDIPTVRKSFARPLKESAAASLDMSITEIETFKKKGRVTVTCNGRIWNLSGRQYLQRYGAEAHRSIFGDDFWVNQCLPLDDPQHTGQIWVVTDVRFQNEAKRIHWLGGHVWQILRDTDSVEDHISERPLPEGMVDNIIENNGTIEEFRFALELALDRSLVLV